MDKTPKNINLGKNVVIEKDVTIGENVTIGHNTVILRGTKIGNNVQIGANCVLGIKPLGNNQMRKADTYYNHLVIKDFVKIGNIVSIYLGTLIDKHVFIGDHASIRENVTVGENSVIGRASIIELNSKIGEKCTIQTLAYVTGDSILENNVFIGPCVSMSNDKYMGVHPYKLKGPHVKEGAKIGNNASLLPSVTIGEGTIVGAGAVVTKNLEKKQIVAGVPAKKIKDIQ
ncbi:acyltransferase [Metabacillus fastidiosus]|uniref:acyltransferase n=1 Tax=Metabacillus fastidiosus TaxID=1458 RepID=UPI002DC03985|nr:acyltransferase [Metabacillus fastidiosus]MEC2077078.1 acyltransferase [Metabacillus fastidiosus]